MLQHSTALIAVNNSLLLNNQSLFQGLYSLGIQLRNKTTINTKESFLLELENFKPSYALLSTGLAGVISVIEVVSKAKLISPRTKIILFANDSDKGKVSDYVLANTDAIIWNENIKDSLDFCVKQLSKGSPFYCGKCLCELKTSLSEQKTEVKSDLGSLSHLTERELEVLFALTKGINYKQISKQLFISESTVKTHVNNIFTKLNVNDRTQAVLYALNHGIQSLIKKPHILENLSNEAIKK